MTIARSLFSAGAAAGLTVVLAGCMSGGPSAPPVAAAPTGVEGVWLDPKGGIATFNAGAFQTVAADTGEKLAIGSYTVTGTNSVTGANSVVITGTSLARQARGLPSELSFNCLQISGNQLNCTDSTGQNLVLTRRSV